MVDSLILKADRKAERAGPCGEGVKWAGGVSFVTWASYVPGLPARQHMVASENGYQNQEDCSDKGERQAKRSSRHWSVIRSTREKGTGPASRGTWKAFCALMLDGAR